MLTSDVGAIWEKAVKDYNENIRICFEEENKKELERLTDAVKEKERIKKAQQEDKDTAGLRKAKDKLAQKKRELHNQQFE
ncbi:hypothetical protein B7463_g557, partial [Scytalidium lignicola]